MTSLNFDPNEILEMSSYSNTYRVACLNFNKDERMLFLVPKDWTDRQAIEYQFRK